MKKYCKSAWCSAQESCVIEIASVDCVTIGSVVTNVAFYYIIMKPHSQKNDVRCEYTRGSPKPLLLQISINV